MKFLATLSLLLFMSCNQETPSSSSTTPVIQVNPQPEIAKPVVENPLVRALGSVEVNQSNYDCSGRKCYDLTITCPEVYAPISVTLHVAEAVGKYLGLVSFHSGSGGMGLWGPEDKPSSNQVLQDIKNAGYKTVEVQYNTIGWTAGSSENKEGLTALACRPATVLKWIYDNLYTSPTLNEGFCATGNSGGSVQISSALINYGLDQYIDLLVPTAGPGMGRVDEGCLNPDSNLYFINQHNIFDKTYGFFPPLTGPCTLNDTSYLDKFTNDSLALGNRDFYHSKTMIWNLVGESDVDTATNPQSLEVYNQWLAKGNLYLKRETLAGVGHGVNDNEIGAAKIKEVLLNQCKKYTQYNSLSPSSVEPIDLKTNCTDPYYYLNGNNKHHKLSTVILNGYTNVRGEITLLDGSPVVAINDFTHSCVNLNTLIPVGNYYLQFFDMNNNGKPIIVEDRNAVLSILSI